VPLFYKNDQLSTCQVSWTNKGDLLSFSVRFIFYFDWSILFSIISLFLKHIFCSSIYFKNTKEILYASRNSSWFFLQVPVVQQVIFKRDFSVVTLACDDENHPEAHKPVQNSDKSEIVGNQLNLLNTLDRKH
jgi:hypothetical protein